MKTKNLIVIMGLLFISCKNNNDKLEQEIINSFEQNNQQLKNFSQNIERDYEDKSTRIEYRDKAIYYLEKMKKTDTAFQKLLKTFTSLKEKELNTQNLNKQFINFKNSLVQIDSGLIKEMQNYNKAETFNSLNKNLLVSFYINKATVFHNICINCLSKRCSFVPIIYDK